MLDGEARAVRDIVLLNGHAGIVSYELFRDAARVQFPIVERLARARDTAAAAIDSGAAAAKLSRPGWKPPPGRWS